MDDPIVAIIVCASLVLLMVHVLWLNRRCSKRGHSWRYDFHHETQQERIRCQICGKWAGEP